MKPLKITLRIATFGTLGLACLAANPIFASEDGNSATNKTFTAPNGNTVEVRKVERENDNGDISKRRGFKVTDPEGELVRRGHDRVRVNADGSKSRAQRRERVDADGNTYQKRRRAHADGEGNVRGQRHARVKDADGNITRRARSSGKRSADGSRVKRNQRQFTDRQGRKTDVRRKVRVDNQGNRHVKRKVRKG